MGIEKLWTQSRADRTKDPEIQRDLAAEKARVIESMRRAGDQTKEATATIIYNSLVRPFVPVRVSKKRTEFQPARQVVDGATDSTFKAVALVGRILMTSGRVTKYGIRRALAI